MSISFSGNSQLQMIGRAAFSGTSSLLWFDFSALSELMKVGDHAFADSGIGGVLRISSQLGYAGKLGVGVFCGSMNIEL